MAQPGLVALQEVLRELQALGPDPGVPAPRTERRVPGAPGEATPALPDVLFGLGYLVALQERPEAAAVLSAGAGQAALEVLRAVVKQWLAVNSASDEQRGAVTGFYDRANEHLRRLGLSRPAPPA